MKKVLIIAGFMAAVTAGHAQTKATAMAASPGSATAPATTPDVLVLKEKVHNFGKIPQGRPTTYTFEIANKGTEPLLLSNVMASCGCTTPEWSRDPIAPGGTAKIKVGYNAYAEGSFTKTVTIFYGDNKTKLLTITGIVYKSPATSAPPNESVQFLKQTNQ